MSTILEKPRTLKRYSTRAQVDLTERIAPLKAHKHMKFNQDEMKFQLTSAQVEFALDMLSKVHTSCLVNLKDQKITEEERQRVYDTASLSEQLYAAICGQLKLYSSTRLDLN